MSFITSKGKVNRACYEMVLGTFKTFIHETNNTHSFPVYIPEWNTIVVALHHNHSFSYILKSFCQTAMANIEILSEINP